MLGPTMADPEVPPPPILTIFTDQLASHPNLLERLLRTHGLPTTRLRTYHT